MPAVAVTLAEQAAEAHQLDEQLVGREPVRASRELVGRRLEGRLGRGVKGLGVRGPDPLHQQAHVVRCGRRRGTGRAARPGGDDHRSEQDCEQDPSHRLTLAPLNSICLD